jgi:5'-3' exoribonuclease 1
VIFFKLSPDSNSFSPEDTNFFLLHLCLLREYLDLEFRSIAACLPFPYSLEHIIDDFVLLAVFVGNDFLPHLPDLHIHENALERLFDIYKRVLPTADGYINNSGVIDVKGLQKVLNGLKETEVEVFYKEIGDSNWVNSKRKPGAESTPAKKKETRKFLSPRVSCASGFTRTFMICQR